MGYPPGERGYRVRSIATNHFFTSGNVIFDENIPYTSLHSVSTASNEYSVLPFLAQRPSVIPAAPELPPNPSNLDTDMDNLDDLGTPPRASPSPPPIAPVTPPPGMLLPPMTPQPVRTRSRDGSRTSKLTE